MTSQVKGGIICYHSKSNQWESFPKKNSKNYLLFTENGIADLTPSGKPVLWLAFDPGTGLVKYDYENDSLVFFEHRNGLLSDNMELYWMCLKEKKQPF